jgi:hypothetical protein
MSDDYPMDISERFPIADKPKRIWRAASHASGRIVDAHTGDMTVEAAYITVVAVWGDVYRTLAFADILDSEAKANSRTLRKIGDSTRRLETSVERLEAALSSLSQRAEAVRDAVDGLIEVSGAVSIPAWTTTEEVEHGDDMGMVHQSAHELGLTVVYSPEWNPAADIREVLWTNPPAGSVVRRGSTVHVEIAAQ